MKKRNVTAGLMILISALIIYLWKVSELSMSALPLTPSNAMSMSQQAFLEIDAAAKRPKKFPDDALIKNNRAARGAEAQSKPSSEKKVKVDLKGMLTERTLGYSWSKNIRAVRESQLTDSDKVISKIDGFGILENPTAVRDTWYVISGPESNVLGIYSGDLIVVTEDAGFEIFLKREGLMFNRIGASYFIKEANLESAFVKLETVLESYPKVACSLDIITNRQHPL
ncbi:MAG: hypothetical protein EOP48_00170 [Sphingobacteriales bacterium]|nr:MAG: hypothetical protein EOP48_00170 [Sphingobacteriales bacterium]